MADVPRNPEEFRFREPRQERIHRRLLLVGQNAAAFYRDICRLVDGMAQLETATHTIGHNLREIESALQHVLLPLVTPEVMTEAKKRYAGKKAGHLVKVEAILQTLGLADVPATAETWRKLADPDGEARARAPRTPRCAWPPSPTERRCSSICRRRTGAP